MAKNYNTAGKTRLVDFLKDHAEAQLTVEDICLSLNGNLSKRSSVYRNLSSLCDEGSVKKFHPRGWNLCAKKKIWQFSIQIGIGML